MTIVTCDVVEASARASSSIYAEVTTSLADVARSLSLAFLASTVILISPAAFASDQAFPQAAYNVLELGLASDVAYPQNIATTIVTDDAVATSSALYTPSIVLTESATASDSIVSARSTVLYEAGSALDSIYGSNLTTWEVTDIADAKSSMFGYDEHILTDQGRASDYTFPQRVSFWSVTDLAMATDTAYPVGAIEEIITESATAADTYFTQSNATTVITDTAYASDSTHGPAITSVWVVNTENYAMSRYTHVPFTSIAVFKGRTFGIGEDGLYEMTGDTDLGQPIEASITTGRSTLGTKQTKRVENVYIDGTASDDLKLTVNVEGRLSGDFSYNIPKRISRSARGNRVTIAKGLTSVFWQFTISNINGADFFIDTVSIDVVPSTNRRL